MAKKRKLSRKQTAKKVRKKLKKREQVAHKKKIEKARYQAAWCKPGALVTFRAPSKPNGPNEWVFDNGIWVWESIVDFQEWIRMGIHTNTKYSSSELEGVYGIVAEKRRPMGHFVLVKVLTDKFVAWVDINDLVKAKRV